jgi:SAM-dependent methyltransferase
LPKPRNNDWDAMAREAPYFPILREDGTTLVQAGRVATAEFWASGENDLTALLEAAGELTKHPASFATSLELGCGPGRLTLPLARRSTRVVACDVSRIMLEHARQNVRAAHLENVHFIEPEELRALPDEQFTFVLSLLTFQYIPRSAGYELIRMLLRLLAPNGTAALHLVLAPPGEALRQCVRWSASRKLRPSSERVLTSHSRSEEMRTFVYDSDVLLKLIHEARASLLGCLNAPVGTLPGVLMIIEKPARG